LEDQHDALVAAAIKAGAFARPRGATLSGPTTSGTANRKALPLT